MTTHLKARGTRQIGTHFRHVEASDQEPANFVDQLPQADAEIYQVGAPMASGYGLILS